MNALDGWLAARSAARAEGDTQRELVARDPDPDLVDLAGNDYLGLSRHPDVTAAAAEAALRWGAGAGSSRLVSGTLRLHESLEQRLGELLGQEAAVVTS
nr:aminotransferase class I/II-fold pyridoxal phosphate-dependent enzyme [Nocardioidaceae bacterium]